MSTPKSHTTVVAPRSHAPLPPPATPSPDTPIRNRRRLLAVLALMGLIGSVCVALLVLVAPGTLPAMPESSHGRSTLPIPIMILVGGYVLIGLAMVFIMPSPWYGIGSTIFGMRRRRRNWALLTASLIGAVTAGGGGALLTTHQIQAPVAVMREGHYELRQKFQTLREISGRDYADWEKGRKLFTVPLLYLPESLFCICGYLGAFLYALWYLRVEPQVDLGPSGYWDELLR